VPTAGASYQPRNRLISFRISQELYDLVRIASVQLADGSISDFARAALEDAILQQPAAAARVATEHISTLVDLATELNDGVRSLKTLLETSRDKPSQGQLGRKTSTGSR
jgi:hypothetical protein